MRWTQCPTSAVGSGIISERNPRLIGRQVWPASSLRNAPAAEMATKMRSGLARIEKNGVEAHPAGAGLPEIAFGGAQPGEFLPGFAAVRGAEERGVLRSGVDRVGIGQRRFEMPDALEFPRVLGAVVPLVGAGDTVVNELVPDRAPRSCRRLRSVESFARTSRWIATHRSGSDQRANP